MPLLQQPLRPWHAVQREQLWSLLETSEQGLSESRAAERLARYGLNQLPEKQPPSLAEILLRQFYSPLIFVLVLAVGVSLLVGDYKDAGFITLVLLINAVIGAYQEWKAEQSSHALRKLLQIHAAVERDGEVREIGADRIVPGDVVWLESGNRVPADVRLLSAHGLEVDEALLTGESVPVIKDPAWEGEEDTPLGDRLSMAYAGAIVARGRAKGVVVATGAATSVGQLATDVLGEVGGKPPLLERMERFAQWTAFAAVFISICIGALGVFLGRYAWGEMFLFAVALAVSAIPEGLPVAMTVALAIATTRMARRGVIVRRLTAVEGLGSCTLIATDKTGTLTRNEMMVQALVLADGESFVVTGAGFSPQGTVLRGETSVAPDAEPQLDRLARAGVLCNEAELHPHDGDWTARGDAVDVALLSLGRKLGRQRETTLDAYPQVNEIPFESERQFAASYHLVDGRTLVMVKGSPERVISMCALAAGEAEILEKTAADLAERGFRVLALAEGEVDSAIRDSEAPPQPSGLELLGFVGMIDPLREGVKEAIEACHQAGVAVSMVTGDHRVTALAIARELGMAETLEQVVTGGELSEKSPDELAALVNRVRVFARVAPRQKLEIVQAARRAGHYVAVTGDGVNDAPALRAANIGVAMGKAGTDVAREAAELVLSDDNFANIVAGVEEGRVAYDNLRKVIYLLISTGAAEVLMVLLTVAAGYPLPLLPVQLLWLNLVTNGIQGVALAFEPNEGDVLQRPPRPPTERIFDSLMIVRTLLAVVVMGGLGFAWFAWLIEQGWSEAEARNSLLLLMVLFENVHIGNCRSESKSAFAFSPLRSPVLLIGAIGALLVQVIGMYFPPLRAVLETAPIDFNHWMILIGIALAVLPAIELHKWSYNRRRGTA